MTAVTGPALPLTKLPILKIDAGQPGQLDLTLDEHLQCPSCGHTGDTWQISLIPNSPPSPGQRRRTEDPGG